jgi:hypothetical protein
VHPDEKASLPFFITVLLLFFALLPVPSRAAGVDVAGIPGPVSGTGPVPPLQERVGVVSSHLKNYPPEIMELELEAVRKGGFGWIRCDFAWYDLEPRRGEWKLQGTDLLVEMAEGRGLKILGILGSCPPWANEGNSWNYPPTDLEAWKAYVRTVVTRYRGRVAAWEIWNEENIHAFWHPDPDPAAYVSLLAAASEVIRGADPGARVVMGGVAGLDPYYLQACLTLGAARYVDVLAYHPYAETIGEEGQPESDRLRPKERLCRQIAGFVRNLLNTHEGSHVEIWVTEVGWTTGEGELGVDETTQADYLARTLLNYGSTEVSKVFVYNLRDTLLNEADRYGLLRADFSAKDSYRVVGNLLREVEDARPLSDPPFALRCSRQESLEAHAYLARGGDILLSLWKSDDNDDAASLLLKEASSYRDPLVVDLVSGSRVNLPGAARDPSGTLAVEGLRVGKRPLFILFPRVEVRSVSPSRGYQFTLVMNLERVEGRGFAPGVTVELVKGGSRLACYDVQVLSESELRCRVGLWGAEPGRYDLVLVNPDGSRAMMPSAFEVVPVCGAGAGFLFLAGPTLLAAAWLTARCRKTNPRFGVRRRVPGSCKGTGNQ